jgi:hypothetical protein
MSNISNENENSGSQNKERSQIISKIVRINNTIIQKQKKKQLEVGKIKVKEKPLVLNQDIRMSRPKKLSLFSKARRKKSSKRKKRYRLVTHRKSNVKLPSNIEDS